MVWLTEALPCQVKHNWMKYVLNLLNDWYYPFDFTIFYYFFNPAIEKLQNNQIISREITWLHKFQFDFINILAPLSNVVDETAGSYYIFHGW